ncbi:aminotransferase class III-fold pyridoxal phosphate-dependent enzyme [Actinomadura sp. 3N407]|uniref:aminotransferase class III-fold pyridoxal phosphate-dependent enzyme n=1 Tax=Actinomadura sp. 3N407 TaxID=3457423 RepID=UPI003FCC5F75
MGSYLRNLNGPGRFLVHGEGAWVHDHDGRRYLDARSSMWHGILGHGHPAVISAIREQAERLMLGGTVFYDRPPHVTVTFAERLASALPGGLRRIRLGGSGAQMLEGAVMLSRLHRAISGTPDRTAVISMAGGYHGMNTAALALSGSLASQHGFYGPLPNEVYFADQSAGSWTAAVLAVADRLGDDRVTAVLIEPIMSSTGDMPATADLLTLAELCRDREIHLIADEVTTGHGRVGALSRMNQLGVLPDMLVLGPALTGGYLPAAALAVSEEIFQDMAEPPNGLGLLHGSTTDGNPLAAAAGLAVLDVLQGGVLSGVPDKARLLTDTLVQIRDAHLPAGDVAGVGLLQRLVLRTSDGDHWLGPEATMLRDACEENGLLVSTTSGCLFVVPPLTIIEHGIHEIGERLDRSFRLFRTRS